MEKQVITIPVKPAFKHLTRVAAYARVSTGKDAMLQSLAAQVSYYSDLIQHHPGWCYAGVYADEARTGTKDTREEFQRLLADCKAGRIDMIITKSVSRFARNTVTTLETVRELKAIGVDVYFEEQNIHSMSGDGEVMLTILAAFAQEESLSVSENCKWRIRKKLSDGDCTSLRMYGYRVKDGRFTIIPEEAEVIRLIYSSYLSGMGARAIATMLNGKSIPSFSGSRWPRETIVDILRNEKLAGNLLLQKTFRADHLTKKKKRNHGELPQYYVGENHEAIIDQETFDRVQAEMKRRAELYDYGNSPKDRHPLSSKVTCGVCGKRFTRKFANTKGKIPIWICKTYLSKTKLACPSRRITEKVLFPILAEALGVPEEAILDEASRIQEITVYPDGRLMIHMDNDSIERHWENPARALGWTKEMRLKAAERDRLRREHNGEIRSDDTTDA